jgi:hypothetical protein
MSWQAFEESFINTDDHVVLGRRLKPFCLWYQFVLEAIDSPIFSPNAPLSLVDLEIAARICQSDYQDFTQAQQKPGFMGKVKFGVKAMRTSIADEVSKFDRYILDYARLPETFENIDPPTERVHHDFPPALSIVSVLMRNGFEGGQRKATWMTGVGEAHWYATSFTRLEGHDPKLITDHDREFMEGLRAEREEKARREAEESEIDTPNSDE